MKEELKSLFAEIVGLNNVINDPALFGPYTDDFTDHYVSKPLAVVRPSTTEQVSKIVKLCAQYNVPIVTQGGNTSLTGAAAADGCVAFCRKRQREGTINTFCSFMHFGQCHSGLNG